MKDGKIDRIGIGWLSLLTVLAVMPSAKAFEFDHADLDEGGAPALQASGGVYGQREIPAIDSPPPGVPMKCVAPSWPQDPEQYLAQHQTCVDCCAYNFWLSDDLCERATNAQARERCHKVATKGFNECLKGCGAAFRAVNN
ncbi:MAG: hypothetical protein AB7P04_14650 [Bacteriovoracia bacterium]